MERPAFFETEIQQQKWKVRIALGVMWLFGLTFIWMLTAYGCATAGESYAAAMLGAGGIEAVFSVAVPGAVCLCLWGKQRQRRLQWLATAQNVLWLIFFFSRRVSLGELLLFQLMPVGIELRLNGSAVRWQKVGIAAVLAGAACVLAVAVENRVLAGSLVGFTVEMQGGSYRAVTVVRRVDDFGFYVSKSGLCTAVASTVCPLVTALLPGRVARLLLKE